MDQDYRASLNLRSDLERKSIVPAIGVYDVFSAILASRQYDTLFISGFGFAASQYGLPDIGFVTWSDVIAFVQRIRSVLPHQKLIVDIDDGFCDPAVAIHTVKTLEAAGAAGVVLEDQLRPRKCGHFDNKRVMAIPDYVEKLKGVLAARKDLFVIARTDSSDKEDILTRVEAYAGAGADAVLVDGIQDVDFLRTVRERVDCHMVFNQIAGGKSRPSTWTELHSLGVSLVIYSTPCLFAAQSAIEQALKELAHRDGKLPSPVEETVGVQECTAVLNEN